VREPKGRPSMGTFVRTHVWVSIAAAAILGGLIGSAGGAATAAQEKERLESQLASARDDVAERQESLQLTNDRLGEATLTIEELEERIAEVEDAFKTATARRPMPNLVGDDEDAALAIADEFGWDITVKEQSSEQPVGTVLSQTPAPGTKMRAGAPFTVVIAKEPPPGWKDLKVWSGQGTLQTEEVNLPDGKVRLLYEFSGGTNAQIALYQRPKQFVELYLNEIGDRSGETRVYYSGRYFFEINGGTWTVRLQVFR
jgi:PASTA domain